MEKKGSPAARNRAQCRGRQDVCETPTMGVRSRLSRYLVIMVVKVKDGVYEYLKIESDCLKQYWGGNAKAYAALFLLKKTQWF